VWVFNGSDLLVMPGRNIAATWRSLGTLCRERDWSRPRLLHELRQGRLPQQRTFPPGYVIDWHDPNVERTLNLETSEVSFYDEDVGRAHSYSGHGLAILSLGEVTVGVEVLPPTEYAVPAPPVDLPPGARWAFAAAGCLKAEGKIWFADGEWWVGEDWEKDTEGGWRVRAVKKKASNAAVARLLAAEARKAVKAGELGHALKASYLEDRLAEWGICPLGSLK
jgi:hypothetical protein